MDGTTLLISGGVVLLILLALVFYWLDKKSSAAFKLVAEQQGWSLAENAADPRGSDLAHFDLLTPTKEVTISYVMRGQVNGAEKEVFELAYARRRGKGRSSIESHTALCFRSDSLDLPQFALRPTDLASAFRDALGTMQDIDFPAHPQFSRRVVLQGLDEPAVRRLFNETIISFFEQNDDIYAEGYAQELLLFTRRLAPQQLPSFVERSGAALKLFQAA